MVTKSICTWQKMSSSLSGSRVRKSYLALCLAACSMGLLAGCSASSEDRAARAELQAQNAAIEAKIADVNSHPKHLNLEEAQQAFTDNMSVEQKLQSDYELVRMISSQISTSNIYDASMQPVNKREKCLLAFIVGGEGKALYWDGKCSKGKAVGLGRAVITQDGKKVLEMLLEIDNKEPNTLRTFLSYDVNSSESEVGYSELFLKNGILQGYSATMGYNIDAWTKAQSLILSSSNDEGATGSEGKEIEQMQNGANSSAEQSEFNLNFRYEDTTNLVSYTRIVDMLSGETSSIIAYPNYSLDLLNASDNVMSNIDRTYRILEGRQMVGMSYIWYKDGKLIMRDNATGYDVVLDKEPEALTLYVQDMEGKVTAKTALVEDKVSLGINKLEEYAKQKCKRPVPFFKGDEVNYTCDYLLNLTGAYEEFKAVKDHQAKVLESYNQRLSHRLNLLNQHLEAYKSN